jgi:hypothetical protein
MFYLFIPFYNLLINKMTKKQYKWLLGLLLFYFTAVSTFLFTDGVFREATWYMVLYFVAAYIRLYPAEWMEQNRVCGLGFLINVFLAYASVIVVDFIGTKMGFEAAYYMISDSNHFLAFTIGVFAFLFFKNIKMRNSRIVNKIASTTFGVLCIHASSDAMRTFLWKDLLDVSGHYGWETGKLALYSAGCVLGVFIVCSLIDLLRIRFVETPVLNWLGKYGWFNKELY